MNEKNIFKLDETGCLSQEDTKKYYSRIGFFYFILAATAFAISLIASIVMNMYFPWIHNNEIVLSLVDYGISFIGIYLIATPLAAIALKPLPRVAPLKEKNEIQAFLWRTLYLLLIYPHGSLFQHLLGEFNKQPYGQRDFKSRKRNLKHGRYAH